MGEPTDVRQIEIDAETVEIEIKGDGSGILIGRHGQTLDALEYIVNRILARRIKDAAPIRSRPNRIARGGASNWSDGAVDGRRPSASITGTLEPMPPRDRRVCIWR